MPAAVTDTTFAGRAGDVFVRRWSDGGRDPDRVVVIAHGIGEHSGRYDHVAMKFVDAGAVVLAPDHYAHGRSAGEPATFGDVGVFVDDVLAVIQQARAEFAALPLVLVGHSMGGLIATRLVQTAPDAVDALVLSGPFIGGNPDFEALAGLDPLPDVPIDPAALSRDPAVGEAYAADPLVYHGPIVKQSLLAVLAAVDAVKAGPGFGDLPVLYLHGELDPLAPLGVTEAVVDQLAGPRTEKKVYAGAMHEIFNETNQDEVIGDAVAFAGR